jgi:hypothetical protein
MKDHERLSLIAVDVDRRTTEEFQIAASKGYWGLRESLDLIWEIKKSNHDIKPKYLKFFTTQSPLKDSSKSKLMLFQIALDDLIK